MFGKDSHTAPISLLEKGVLAEGALPAAGDCLQASCLCVLVQLQQDRKMVNEYLQLSLPYLKDSQASLRYEAVNFIGKPSPWVPLWAQPWNHTDPAARRLAGADTFLLSLFLSASLPETTCPG